MHRSRLSAPNAEGRLQTVHNREPCQDTSVLSSHCDIDNPDQVKQFVFEREVSLARKENIVDIYAKFAKSHNIQFSEPRYTRTDTLPFVPLQQELETLINATRNLKHATLLRPLRNWHESWRSEPITVQGFRFRHASRQSAPRERRQSKGA